MFNISDHTAKSHDASLTKTAVTLMIGVMAFAATVSITIMIVAIVASDTPWIIYPITAGIVFFETMVIVLLVKVRAWLPPILRQVRDHISH